MTGQDQRRSPPPPGPRPAQPTDSFASDAASWRPQKISRLALQPICRSGPRFIDRPLDQRGGCALLKINRELLCGFERADDAMPNAPLNDHSQAQRSVCGRTFPEAGVAACDPDGGPLGEAGSRCGVGLRSADPRWGRRSPARGHWPRCDGPTQMPFKVPTPSSVAEGRLDQGLPDQGLPDQGLATKCKTA